MPLVVPGLVLGLSVMVCYLTIGGGIYGTIWILLIAYVTRFMPYGMRYNTTSMIQVHRELEESAAIAGASWLMSFWRIVLPLLKPGLLAGWIYIVIVSIRELSSSILLYSPGTEVVSVVDLGAVAERSIRGAFCFWRHDDGGTVRVRHGGATPRQEVRDQGSVNKGGTRAQRHIAQYRIQDTEGAFR